MASFPKMLGLRETNSGFMLFIYSSKFSMHLTGADFSIENFDESQSGVYRCTVEYQQSVVYGYVNAKILGKNYKPIFL
jgi:hypothetical protein